MSDPELRGHPTPSPHKGLLFIKQTNKISQTTWQVALLFQLVLHKENTDRISAIVVYFSKHQKSSQNQISVQ